MPDTTLWCLVEGEDDTFFVTTSPTTPIAELKERIKRKKENALHGVDASNLKLWKVNVNFDGIQDAISDGQYRFKAADGERPLLGKTTVSELWPSESFSHDQLHLYITLPANIGSALQDDETGGGLESPAKRRRLADDRNSLAGVRLVDDPVLEELRQFWKSLWEDKKDPFRMDPVRRGPNPLEEIDVPETMELMHLPILFSSIRYVMVRDDYDKAMGDIENYYTRNTKSVIVVGHPGIGKTILLYYILVKRLFEQKPTILQDNPDYLYVFNANGVKAMSPSMFVHPESAEYQNTWALVDLNFEVQKPGSMLIKENNPFFLVMASSPRPSRLQRLEKLGRPSNYWIMKPFSLAELIQARQLQPIIHEESDIANFFENYGPSARDCYDFCKADELHKYVVTVRSKVKEMSWDLITEILTSHPADIRAGEGSHKVLLVEPQLEDRAAPRIRIITKTVSQLLWERDTGEHWRNHHKLFKTLLQLSEAKAFLGTFFEPAFHDLCVHGATFTLYPMNRTTGSTNYIFKNNQENDPRRLPTFQSKSETLELRAQPRVFFDHENNQITSLLADHYYQPIAKNYPSYDSFIYDPNSHQISAFQVTTAEEHGLSPNGVNALHDLGQELKIYDLKIRIILVVVADAKITFKVPKGLIQSLHSEVYTVGVTENQLYPHS